MTLTSVLLNQINTGGVVLTLTLNTVIYVNLTAVTLKTSGTMAAGWGEGKRLMKNDKEQ